MSEDRTNEQGAEVRRADPRRRPRGRGHAQPSFDSQVVLVTGAGQGIGRAYALELARLGACVVVNDVGSGTRGEPATGSPTGPAHTVAEEIRAAGGQALADARDVTVDAAGMVDAAVEAYGRLDAVVCNAGISGGGEIDTITAEDFSRMVEVHYLGTVDLLRAAWPVMRAQGYGRVVTTSSNSVLGMPFSSHYVSAKAAVVGLTRALALDGAPLGIRVNAVMPTAYTRLTSQVPDEDFRTMLRTHFRPEMVAPFVAALASDQVPCSGETFVVGGGRAARVFLGVAPGYVPGEPAAATAGEYLDNFDRVLDPSGYHLPATSMDETRFRAGLLGFAVGAEPTLGSTAKPTSRRDRSGG